jgi:hypothetical protein
MEGKFMIKKVENKKKRKKKSENPWGYTLNDLR